ncbi:MAG: Glu/Leu/Phe/Val dehydrogenase dimerization domain-containing protein, partial [Eggerthellaceae bacterium]
MTSIEPALAAHPEYEEAGLLERMVEPERVVMFRVPWVDDAGHVQVNRGYRVQYNSALGPYKGGVRFHPSVNLSIIKFLGFEQCLEQLTTLPMGGSKNDADFDPKGKSDRSCASARKADRLSRHIGADTNVPRVTSASAAAVGYMFGQYGVCATEWTGVLTPGPVLRRLARPPSNRLRLVYLVQELLAQKNDSFEGKTVCVSGAGNVAIYATEKAQQLGAKVVTMSDSTGWIHDPEGIKLDVVKQIKEVERARISEYAKRVPGSVYNDGRGVWSIPCDIALPCATQNELFIEDAKNLVN